MEHLRVALLSLHSCPWSKPGGRYTGGMNIYIQNISREMAKLGVTMDIYTCSHEGDDLCSFRSSDDNVRLIHIDAGPCNRTTEAGQAGYTNSLALAIDTYCRQSNLRYDIIHSHYWLSGLAGNCLKDLWRVPHVTMFHTLGALKNSSSLGATEPLSRISHERLIMQSCDQIIASTPVEKLEMLHRYGIHGDKIRVIPCGIDPSLFRPIHRQAARAICDLPEKTTLLFVGRPDPIKGLENLLRAASMLMPENDFQLLVIGCGNHYLDEWRQTACRYGINNLKDHVIFTGPVEHEKMFLYYNAADLCIIPSYHESFCLTALESVACGTPVLATRVGEIPEISRQFTLCKTIPDNSPDTLAQYIKSFLQDIEMDRHGSRAALATHYGWDSIARRIVCDYKDALREPVSAGEAAVK